MHAYLVGIHIPVAMLLVVCMHIPIHRDAHSMSGCYLHPQHHHDTPSYLDIMAIRACRVFREYWVVGVPIVA